MDKERYYIDTHGNDDKAYTDAISKACELADNDLSIKTVVFLIRGKQHTDPFDRIFGSDIVRKLQTGTTFKNCKPVFRFESLITYKDSFKQSDIVISCFLDEKELFSFDDYNCVKAIIAIPWGIDYMQKWIQRWMPVEIRSNAQASGYPDPSCPIIKALESLTQSINMTTGINNPMDNDLAKTYILALHKFEPLLDADIVGSYLVKHLGWLTRHANKIEELISILNSGQYFKGGQRTGLKNRYGGWKQECQ